EIVVAPVVCWNQRRCSACSQFRCHRQCNTAFEKISAPHLRFRFLRTSYDSPRPATLGAIHRSGRAETLELQLQGKLSLPLGNDRGRDHPGRSRTIGNVVIRLSEDRMVEGVKELRAKFEADLL